MRLKLEKYFCLIYFKTVFIDINQSTKHVFINQVIIYKVITNPSLEPFEL